MLHEDFKKNLNLSRYLGIEETMSEEVKEVEAVSYTHLDVYKRQDEVRSEFKKRTAELAKLYE